jgi:hypothetical protein
MVPKIEVMPPKIIILFGPPGSGKGMRNLLSRISAYPSYLLVIYFEEQSLHQLLPARRRRL